MRIRTITAFVALPAAKLSEARQTWEPLLQKGLDVIAQAKLLLETAGYEVQTTRIATNPFPEFTTNDTVEEACILLDQICSDRGIMMLNVGPASDVQTIQLIPDLISFAIEGAKVMQKIGLASADLNFRFCVAANTKPGIPFFPVGYGPSYSKDTQSVTFALGLECSDLVVDAFARAKAHFDTIQDPSEANAILWERAADELKSQNTFEDACIPLEKLMQNNDTSTFYTGIDVSVAPSCGADSIKTSLTTAYESIIPKFGGAGTLSISALITGVLKKLNVLKCGYSGLMLPIMEDPGLAARFADGSYSVQEVLLYSTVCGCGLDCVPITGDTPLDALANLLADTATLAHRLNKPLSARIFPLPGLTENMHTQFENPLLVNTRVVKLE
ncbi:hypothetical protein NQZ79_g5335 [Umbelopsis isabellina]|nr:hypothetical protein NQZ79_g5335 [Umbelopsis isabellina]